MKKKNSFMLALAAIAFAACSNEDAITNDVSNSGVIDPEGDAWVALSIQSISKTRGLNVPNINNGTADESTIKAVKDKFCGLTIINTDLDVEGTLKAFVRFGKPSISSIVKFTSFVTKLLAI